MSEQRGAGSPGQASSGSRSSPTSYSRYGRNPAGSNRSGGSRGRGGASQFSFQQDDLSGYDNDDYLYDDDEDSGISLSSGLSPRGSQLDLRDPLDLKEATKTLRKLSSNYGAAQGLRKIGKSPFELGIVDDLPSRLAFHQLHTLSGITAKMQQAIDHNKRAFQQRFAETYKLTMRHAFVAWQEYRRNKVVKEQRVAQATARIARSLSRRVLLNWKYVSGLTDPTIKMKNKAAILLARNLKRRVLLEWYAYVQEESYRDEWKRREMYVKMYQHRQRGAFARMVKLFKHARMIRIFSAWKRWSSTKHLKRHKLETAVSFHNKNTLFKVLLTLKNYKDDRTLRKNLRTKLVHKCKMIFLAHIVAEWAQVGQYLRYKREMGRKAELHHKHELQRKAFEALCMAVDNRRSAAAVLLKLRKKRMAAVFHAWIGVQSYNATNEILVERSLAKIRRRMLSNAFYSFCDTIVEMKNEDQGTSVDALEAKIRELEEKNHKLQVENNRYGKFVDTADLGRGRMKQLSEAVSNLQNEGSELKDLVSLMRTDYENMSRTDGKQRVVMENALQRNKMLVKGGSSFNALIRALKQDLVDSRKPKRRMGDENLLYEVDRLSLDEVTVLPDGEIKVKAVPPEREEVLRYKPKTTTRRKEPPPYVPTGGRSVKLGSQTAITSALKKLNKNELGKLEKYLDATTKSQEFKKSSLASAADRPSTSKPPLARD
ncbi:hypothetical protein HOP50_17g79230 [Chloropicon primus]|nr:hypothetical protein HOP50_17g79230 [Chloropicon primus]